jgi:two-component system response regulator AtoC
MVINAAELYKPSCRFKFNPMVDLNQSKIVLLEADSSRRDFLKSTFLRWGYLPFVFEKESICLDNLTSLDPDLVISSSGTSDDTIRFVNSLKMIRYSLPVLLLADDSILEEYINTSGITGVRVYRKNTSLNNFRGAVLQALDPKTNEGNDGTRPLVVGNSPEIAKIKKLIPKLGQSNEAVIIEGEAGTGKELLARAIHSYSNRRNNPFVKVNAVKLPYQLLEGELFGNQNCGAANLPRHKSGILSVSDNTTLFIKEISAIPKWLQAKISELLESGSYSFNPRYGRHKNNVDVRIIASTTRNLYGLVKKGLFREDLFYRLNVLKVRIPPLRDRISDIPALTDFFSCKHCYEYEKSYYQISSDTISGFCEYNWPGNLEELEKIVEQIILCGHEKHVLRKLLKTRAQGSLQRKDPPDDIIDNGTGLSEIKTHLAETQNYSLKSIRQEYIAAIEKNLVNKALEFTGGNRKKSAQVLGISYKSLLNKIKSFDLVNKVS